jgi:hypothetical protein
VRVLGAGSSTHNVNIRWRVDIVLGGDALSNLNDNPDLQQCGPTTMRRYEDFFVVVCL